jgi:hypothetical protein
MLLWREGVDFTTPIAELAACNLLIYFERNVVYHAAWFAAYLVAVLNKILGAESLDCK